jgi:SAM-dependent methyltransferase
MVQQTAYYDAQTVARFYAEYYRAIHGPRRPEELYAKQRARGAAIGAFVTGHVTDDARVLEIGTGAGGILAHFRDLGHAVKGLDFDRRFLDHGRAEGLDLVEGGLEALAPEDRFDLVILSHVLEHVAGPGPFLRGVARHLTPRGLIYVEVPSLEAVAKGAKGFDFLHYFQSAHAAHFSACSFRNLAAAQGFGVVEMSDAIRALVRPAPGDGRAEPNCCVEGTRHLLTSTERRCRHPVRRAGLGARRAAAWALGALRLKAPVKRLLGRGE